MQLYWIANTGFQLSQTPLLMRTCCSSMTIYSRVYCEPYFFPYRGTSVVIIPLTLNNAQRYLPNIQPSLITHTDPCVRLRISFSPNQCLFKFLCANVVPQNLRITEHYSSLHFSRK